MNGYNSQYTGKQIDEAIGKALESASKEDLKGKQATLVSGENIKTVNGESILGEGDITIPKGDDGKTAYEYAKDGGYAGTEAEFAAKLAKEYLTKETDPTVPSWAKASSKPTYTASEVGADKSGTAASTVSTHNVASDAHNDIRVLITGLANRLNTLANSDDTTLDQMAEVVAYIKNNKSLIDGITTSKVNVTDIVNNLTSNVTNKPLSAAQGVALNLRMVSAEEKASNAENSAKASAASASSAAAYAESIKTAKDNGELDGKSVTVSSVTESTESDGENVVTFSDGKTLKVKNGKDYVLTETDITNIAQMVIQNLGGEPISGYIDENGNIVLKGNITDGAILKYEMEDGTTINIGEASFYCSVTNNLTNCTNSNSATETAKGKGYTATISANSGYELKSVTVTMGGTNITSTVVSGGNINISSVTGDIVITATAVEAEEEFINQIPISTDASGNLFVGTNGEKGYKTGYRLSLSSGNETAASGYEVTGFIPAKKDDVIRIKNIAIVQENATNLLCFDSEKQPIRNGNNYGATLYGLFVTSGTEENGVYTVTLSDELNNAFNSKLAYIRIGSTSITDESIVTVNQEIS